MSAALKSVSMATSLAALFTTKTTSHHHPFLAVPSTPMPPRRLSSNLPPFSRSPNWTPLVAQTSDWATPVDEEDAAAVKADGWSEGEDAPAGESEEDGPAEEETESYPEPPEEAKLFVGNLPFDMDSERLAQLFDQAGVVEVAEVIYNRETDQSRGFGFVTMSTADEAVKAVEMFHRYPIVSYHVDSSTLIEEPDGKVFNTAERFASGGLSSDTVPNIFKDVGGRNLTVSKAAPRGTRPERSGESEASFRVYVGNLPWQVDDARLEQVFSEHGKVVDARVVYDRESGRSRGFGFVTMASSTEVEDAIAALDGQSLDGRALRVNIAEERPRRTF